MATGPFSPIEVEVEMRRNKEHLDAAARDFKEICLRAGRAEHAYRQAQARAWLRARADPDLKTDKVKSAWVVQEASAEMLDRDMTRADFNSQSALLKSLQSNADTLRSLARSSRDLSDPRYR